MIFSSLEFLIFLPTLFVIYWFAANKSILFQNTLLLLAGYVFYGWWNWRFLCLLICISVVNYFVGIYIERNRENKTVNLWYLLGLSLNLLVLGFFKYFNFFVDGFIDLASIIGYDLPRSTTKIILPVGISFYTFLSLSYLIDIKRGTLDAERNVINVLLSLSFFPIIIAGPIERPESLLRQTSNRREFNYEQTINGLKHFLWGLFAKVVIADNISIIVDDIFQNYFEYSGSTLLMGILLYSIQLYADFSGYSNMAIGIAMMLGINLMRNFAYPYFSRNVSEFWKRWHISLVTWFRDYVFFPVSVAISSRVNSERVLFIRSDLFIYIIASLVVWFLTGLWHGANYTFIIWGLIHGVFLIIYRWQVKPRKKLFMRLNIDDRNLGLVVIESVLTLTIVMAAWTFFRADSIEQAIKYLSGIFSQSLLDPPYTAKLMSALYVLPLCILFFMIEWIGRHELSVISFQGSRWNRPIRWSVYAIIIFIIGMFMKTDITPFIYSRF